MAEIKKRNKNGKAKSSASVTGGQTLLTHFMSQNKLDEVDKTLLPSTESPTGLAPQAFVEHSDPAIITEALLSGASSPPSSPLTSLPASSNPTSHCSSPTHMKLEIQEQPKKLFPIFEPHSTSQDTRANVALDTPETKVHDGTLVRRNPKRKRTAAPPIESTVVSYKIRLPPSSAPTLSTPSVSSSVIELSSDDAEEPSIITIEDSPVRPRRHYTSKTTNPLPSSNRTDAPSLKHRRPPSHEDHLSQSVFPDRLFQHVQGSQTLYTARSMPLRHRDKGKEYVGAHFTESSSLQFLGIDLHTRSEPFATNDGPLAARDSDQERKIIPDHHRDMYPAISRFFDPPPYDQSPASRHIDPAQLYWNEKWRPRRAIEVLGNERNACYLRDWMNALRLHFDEHADQPSGSQRRSQSSQKSKAGSQPTSRRKRKVAGRPLILREVNRSKKRQRRGELDWVVDDDVSEDELLIDDDYLDSLSLGNDEESLLPTQPNDGWSISSKPFTFGSKIHNTLLLSGPSGSGKTAAIYACAEELGWEVFEVYPGIGKRGPASLENLIGDVGKNHLVQQPRFRLEEDKASTPIDPHPSTSAIQDFFISHSDEAAKPPLRRLRRKTSQGDVIPVDVGWGLTGDEELPSKITDTSTIQVPQTNESFRQSVVLFEEVDILFKDDVGFWPAVIKFIKDCKRPVVMTCNETSSIPTEDLPLQDILNFTPPPASVVISYLRSVCLKERSQIDCEDYLERLAASSGRCPSSHRDSLVNRPEDKSSEDSIPFPLDLRQIINQCQFTTINPFLLSSILNPSIEESRGTAPPSSSDNLNEATGEMNLYESLDGLLSLQRVTNSLSLLDANFSLPERYGAEDSEDILNGQVGFLTLKPVSDHDLPVDPESYIRDSEMVEAIFRSARGFVKADYTFLMDEVSSQPTNERYRSQMRNALGGRVPKAVSVLLQSIVHLDYEPWIRYMVKAEEEDMKTTGSQKGRSTRNSQRGLFFTNMDTEKKDILAKTRLDVCGWDTTL